MIRILLSLLIAASVFSVTLPSAFAEVSDAQFEKQISSYLETAKGKELVGKVVEDYFREKQQQAAKLREEREAKAAEEQFKNPVKLPVGDSPMKGPKDAKVTIIEFSDYQCPYCKRGADTMDELLKAYPNDLNLVFKNLPLPFHKQAKPAAKAALAAGKQGKFWEMHDRLFNNQNRLSSSFFEEQAKDLGLDLDKFKKDLEDPAFDKQIQADMDLAQQNGISGTPGFFVNGIAVKGAMPAEHFKTIIDRWLKEAA
ncbi:MAG: thioredoxin domain-containing protein [Bdellovibrionota bacterium]